MPGGARWRYVWGSTLVFAFAVQMITGLFLWMAYSPSSQTAWESVYYIQHDMQFGWLLRGLHHYMAQTMIAFRTGERGNNPGMSDLMKAISEEDITALAEYLAGL